MPLHGKRVFVTGGAGFIATTLARRLVDQNEIVALDNFHRDALGGTELAEHPNFTIHQGDVLDAELVAELARGATHVVHCAAIAGVDRVRESPVRTMRVNVIGTYNALEAAVGTLDTVERFVDFSTSEVFGTHAFRVTEGQVSTIGSVGEARWTYAVSTPIPGRSSASAIAATTGTARSAEIVSTPSSRHRPTARRTACRSAKSTTFETSASRSPSAFESASTAATRSPSSFARWMARR